MSSNTKTTQKSFKKASEDKKTKSVVFTDREKFRIQQEAKQSIAYIKTR